jgi:hypothetical protein
VVARNVTGIRVERLERRVGTLLRGSLQEAGDAVDGVDLEVGRVASRRTDEIGGLPVIKEDRVGLVREQVDRRRGVKGETLLPDPRRCEREIPQLEPELEAVPFPPLLPPFQPGEIEEQELLGGEEIFLQDPIAREGPVRLP